MRGVLTPSSLLQDSDHSLVIAPLNFQALFRVQRAFCPESNQVPHLPHAVNSINAVALAQQRTFFGWASSSAGYHFFAFCEWWGTVREDDPNFLVACCSFADMVISGCRVDAGKGKGMEGKWLLSCQLGFPNFSW